MLRCGPGLGAQSLPQGRAEIMQSRGRNRPSKQQRHSRKAAKHVETSRSHPPEQWNPQLSGLGQARPLVGCVTV